MKLNGNTLEVDDEEIILLFTGLVVARRHEQEMLDEGRVFSNSSTKQRINKMTEMIEVLS